MLTSVGRTANERAICGKAVAIAVPSRFSMKKVTATIRATKRNRSSTSPAIFLSIAFSSERRESRNHALSPPARFLKSSQGLLSRWFTLTLTIDGAYAWIDNNARNRTAMGQYVKRSPGALPRLRGAVAVVGGARLLHY